MRTVAIVLAAVIVAALFPACRPARPDQQTLTADLVLLGGRIVTLDDKLPEAQALAARDGKIVAVGSSRDITNHIGSSTQVIDLQGQFAMPGFIEGHGHFSMLGDEKLKLDLRDLTSWDQIVRSVGQAVAKAKPGQWIVGSGWHQDKWVAAPRPNVEGFPTHESLDIVSPNNPVVLEHASYHADFVNAKAMLLSGITRTTRNPEGGEILKDAGGAPTGLLRENAIALVRRGAGEPALTAAEVEARARRALELADKEVLAKGITSFQDAGSPLPVIDRIRQMIDEGKLGVRLWMMVATDPTPGSDWYLTNAALAPMLDRMRIVGYRDNRLTIRAIKVAFDGALGSRGAWLLQPYSDKPETVGLNTTSVDSVKETAQLAIDHGYQLCIHAIGDRANRQVLDLYEDAFKRNGKNGRELRWRIEHAQHLSAADIPRFGDVGVIASMQTVHATSDAAFARNRLGDARVEEGAYVWQKLLQSGAVVTNGTDAPVEDVDPIPNYYAAVTRRLSNGSVFYADQKMSRMEALRSYTIQNAFAAFEEDVKGTLSVGKLADIVVLTRDITKVPEEEIRQARVAYTIIGGKVAYRR